MKLFAKCAGSPDDSAALRKAAESGIAVSERSRVGKEACLPSLRARDMCETGSWGPGGGAERMTMRWG